MTVVIIVLAFIVIVFGLALLVGAPFLPTMKQQTSDALDLLNLKPGHKLLDLGSGDGRVLQAAARRGIVARGWEINPILVLISMFRCLGERQLVTVRLGNFWNAPLEETEAVYVFLLKPYMAKLEAKLASEVTKPVKVVSYAFAFPDRKPIKTHGALMLYEFKPAKNK